MAEPLTRVQILYLPDWVNYWLRFGRTVFWSQIDRRRAYAYFRPGQIFGYARWEANDYGTRHWRLSVVQAARPKCPMVAFAGISPGAVPLLVARGITLVKRAFKALGEIEARGFELHRLSAAHFLHIHTRVHARLPVFAVDPPRYRLLCQSQALRS